MSQIHPVYQIKPISSVHELVEWQGLDFIARLLADGYVVLWQHHAVFTGQINGGAIHWLSDENPETGDEHIVRLRAFNQRQEYHFWRTSDGIMGRLRTDDETGKGTEIIDTQMVLRGVVADPLRRVLEGTLSVLTRNYIDYDPYTNQAGYVDSRFVSFTQKNLD